MPNKFIINTQKSLYKPIEIELDGKTYLIRQVTPALLEEVGRFDKDARAGDPKAMVNQLVILTGIEKQKVMKIDIRVISKLLTFITGKIFKPEELKEEEKNESGPEADK